MSLGALIIILSLAMDPMVQQIVSFEPTPVSEMSPLNTIPRSLRYSGGKEGLDYTRLCNDFPVKRTLTKC